MSIEITGLNLAEMSLLLRGARPEALNWFGGREISFRDGTLQSFSLFANAVGTKMNSLDQPISMEMQSCGSRLIGRLRTLNTDGDTQVQKTSFVWRALLWLFGDRSARFQLLDDLELLWSTKEVKRIPEPAKLPVLPAEPTGTQGAALAGALSVKPVSEPPVSKADQPVISIRYYTDPANQLPRLYITLACEEKGNKFIADELRLAGLEVVILSKNSLEEKKQLGVEKGFGCFIQQHGVDDVEAGVHGAGETITKAFNKVKAVTQRLFGSSQVDATIRDSLAGCLEIYKEKASEWGMTLSETLKMQASYLCDAPSLLLSLENNPDFGSPNVEPGIESLAGRPVSLGDAG